MFSVLAMAERLMQCCPKFDSLHVGVKCSTKLCVPLVNVSFTSLVAGVSIGGVALVWVVWKISRKSKKIDADTVRLFEQLRKDVLKIGAHLDRIECIISESIFPPDRIVLSGPEVKVIFPARVACNLTKLVMCYATFKVLLREKLFTSALKTVLESDNWKDCDKAYQRIQQSITGDVHCKNTMISC